MYPIFYQSTNNFPRPVSAKSLNDLFIQYQNDKAFGDDHQFDWHFARYTEHCLGYALPYEEFLGHLKNSKFRMLEIGICDNRFSWASTKVYLTYFHNMEYWGLDNFEVGTMEALSKAEPNIQEVNALGANIIFGDQGDAQCLQEILKRVTNFGIIIDDGSHETDDIWTSLEVLWPALVHGGYYLVEDLCSSWPFPLGRLIHHENSDVWNAFFNKACPNGVVELHHDDRVILLEHNRPTPVSDRGTKIINKIMSESTTITFVMGQDSSHWVAVIKKR